jgi:hypothetical protein
VKENEQVGGSKVPHGGRHGLSDDGKTLFLSLTDGAIISTNSVAAWDLSTDPPTVIPLAVSERSGSEGNINFNSRFLSATRSGNQAYIISEGRLTNDAPEAGGLYRVDLTAPAGDRLTWLLPTSYNDISNAVVSDDQSHIYFTSERALAAGAAPGDKNAYMWSEATGIRFIAKLDSAGEFRRVTTDGRFALIVAAESIGNVQTNGYKEVYEYDAETDQTVCVSCRPDGQSSSGDSDLTSHDILLPNNPSEVNRGVSDDGRVLFVSRGRLLSRDVNDVDDVYLYSDGKLSLISSGRGTTKSYTGDISDDGKTATLITGSALLPLDHDPEQLDVYAARIDGGFAEPPPPAAPCEGEACRGAASSQPAGASAPTSTFVGPGDTKCPKGKARRNGRCVAKRHGKKHHRNGKHASKNMGGAR